MKPGLRLSATYKKAEHTAEVVAGEDGKLVYRLADGREFKSPSAAASAVMGGIAANGWRFWTIADGDGAPKPAQKAPAPKKGGGKKPAAKKPARDAKAQLGEMLGMDEEDALTG